MDGGIYGWAECGFFIVAGKTNLRTMAVNRTIPMPPPQLLDGKREISTAQRDEFRDNGHLLVRGLLDLPEMAVYRGVILEAVKKQSREKRRLPERGIYGRMFGQLVNLWRVDEGVRQFVLSKRLARVAADLLGVSGVRIYHDHALFKEAGGRATYWHQDQYYWPLDTADTVTMAMPLVDQSVEMGMFVFASGSHKNGTLWDPKLSSEPDGLYRRYIREHHFSLTCAAGMRAGDATWHYGNTVHHTLGNESDRRREMMTITYMADGARVTQPAHKAQVHELNMWLMGLPPGRLAASELNPLIV
jgi:ectoine hydroxylase-related dioxygenase (phytanoyl-CoA dioxygenase family)